MFLFTTPPPARENPPSSGAASRPVVDAIRAGAERTGTSFDYLLATAKRESALDPAASAPTSSAKGLFQFIEQTWLSVVKSDGPRLGLGEAAGAIATRADGVHTVQDPQQRKAILDLRTDPQVASTMAGALTQRNREVLAAELGRDPSAADLYVAHFLGARGGAQLAAAARSEPTRAAARDFPEAAAANRSIFFDRSGRARGAGEVYALLSSQHAGAAGTEAAPAFAPERPLAFARSDGPALHALFRTEGSRAPVSEAVAKLWRRPDTSSPTQVAALGGFFPRGTAAAEPETAAPAAEAAAASVPLPPPRPADLVPAARPRAAASVPLDLVHLAPRPVR